MERHPPHSPALGARTECADADHALLPCRPAGEVLAAEHPLSRTGRALEAVTRHVLTVGALLCVSAAGWAVGATWAGALMAAAGAVLLTLAAAAGILLATRGAHARALIELGEEHIAVAAIRAERRRLLDDDRRVGLARLLDRLARRSAQPWRPGRIRPLYDARTIAAASADLRGVAELLRDRPPSARGVAAAHRLVTDGASPLYGADAGALRAELQRIRFLLHC